MLLSLALFALVAMAVDLAYAMHVRAEAQTSADAAALAGAWELIHPDRIAAEPDATQAIINARSGAVEYAAKNEIAQVFPEVDRNDANAADGEIVVGHLPTWSYPPIYPWQSGSANYLWEFANPNKYNTVCARVQRTEARNGPVPLYFGRIFGMPSMNIHTAATAIIEWGQPIGFRPTSETGNSSLMPFAMHYEDYDYARDFGTTPDGTPLLDEWDYSDPPLRSGSDGKTEVKLYPAMGPGGWEEGQGNFGTVDIGTLDNSGAVLKRQIIEGVSDEDLSVFPFNGQFSVDPDNPIDLQGDTGLTAGIENALESIIGECRTILLYETVVDPGNNAMFTIIRMEGVVICDVELGGNDKHLTVQPAVCVDDSVIIGGPPDGDEFPTIVRPPRLIH
jgi:Flp pilus assembly protein TadG